MSRLFFACAGHVRIVPPFPVNETDESSQRQPLLKTISIGAWPRAADIAPEFSIATAH